MMKVKEIEMKICSRLPCPFKPPSFADECPWFFVILPVHTKQLEKSMETLVITLGRIKDVYFPENLNSKKNSLLKIKLKKKINL